MISFTVKTVKSVTKDSSTDAGAHMLPRILGGAAPAGCENKAQEGRRVEKQVVFFLPHLHFNSLVFVGPKNIQLYREEETHI